MVPRYPYPRFCQSARPLQSPWNLKINEWFADGARVFNDDFIKFTIHHRCQFYSGFYLTDNPVGNPTLHRIATNSYIAAKSHIAFLATGKNPPVIGYSILNSRPNARLSVCSLLTSNKWTRSCRTSAHDLLKGAPLPEQLQLQTHPPNTRQANNSVDPNETALMANLRIVEIMYNPWVDQISNT